MLVTPSHSVNAYDAFDHLQRSLFVQPSDRMVMLTVYCDDSGDMWNQFTPKEIQIRWPPTSASQRIH